MIHTFTEAEIKLLKAICKKDQFATATTRRFDIGSGENEHSSIYISWSEWSLTGERTHHDYSIDVKAMSIRDHRPESAKGGRGKHCSVSIDHDDWSDLVKALRPDDQLDVLCEVSEAYNYGQILLFRTNSRGKRNRVFQAKTGIRTTGEYQPFYN